MARAARRDPSQRAPKRKTKRPRQRVADRHEGAQRVPLLDSALPLPVRHALNHEAKRAEEALRESEERLRRLLEAAFEGIIIHEDGVILDANPAFAAMSGHSLSELTGKSVFSLLTRQSRDLFIDKIRSGEGDPDRWEAVTLRKDGTTLDVEVVGRTYTYRGRPARVTAVRDITERKRAEEALRGSEEKYRSLVRESLDGIVIAEGRQIRFVNPALLKMFGCEREEDMVGHAFTDFISPEYRQPLAEMGYAREKGQAVPDRYEYKALRKDGMEFYAEISVNKTTYQGRVARQGIVRDITERKRAEEALRYSEQRHRLLVENVSDVIWTMDLNLKYTYASSVTPIRGYSVEEAMSQTMEEALTPASAEVARKVLAEELAIEQMEDSDPARSRTLEVEFNCRDGSTIWCEVKMTGLRDHDNRLVGVLGVSRDITERKRAEEALRESEREVRLIADNIPALFSYVDADGRYRVVNKRYEDWFGIPQKEIIGKHYREVLGEATYHLIGEHVETALSGRPVHYEAALPYRHRGERWVNADYIPDVDDQGKVKGFFALVTDITERKRAEESLRQAEHRYRDLFEEAPVMYVITRNEQGAPVVGDCNQLFLSTLGYTRADVLERPLAEFYTAESHAELLEGGGYERALQGQFLAEERQLLARDGRVVDTLLRALPETDPDGRVFGTRAMYVDITERKRAQEALRESEERFRQVAETAGEWISELDAKGRYTYSSPAVRHILGYEPQDVLGKHFYDFFPPQHKKQLLAEAREIGARKEAYFRAIAPNVHRDGHTVLIESSGLPILDTEGNVLGYRNVAEDITERKRAEEALRESEDRFRSLFEATFEGIVIHEDGVILDANPAFEKMVGRPLSELVGTSGLDLLASASRDLVRQKMMSEAVEHYEALGLREDGTTFCFELLSKPYTYRGRPARVVAARDITERKRAEEALRESEERYRLIAENASDVIWTVDMNLRPTYFSPSITLLTGYSAEEVMAAPMEEVLTPASLEAAMEAFAEELAVEKMEQRDPLRSRTGELEMYCRDGSTVWTEVKITFLRDPDGQPVGILGVSRDISERKRAEATLEKAREELEWKVERRMRRGNDYGLTFRELTVLNLVARGSSDREIGIILGISHLTAQKHVANILGKMEAASRTSAGVRALREGLLD